MGGKLPISFERDWFAEFDWIWYTWHDRKVIKIDKDCGNNAIIKNLRLNIGTVKSHFQLFFVIVRESLLAFGS